MNSPGTNTNWFSANRDYLMASISRLKLLIQRAYRKDEFKAADLNNQEKKLALLEKAVPGVSTLQWLASTFDLNPFEIDLLLMAVAKEFDSSFLKLDEETELTANFSLALAALPEADWQSLAPSSSLRKWGLVELSNDSSLTTAPLKVPESIVHFLTGLTGEDATVNSTSDSRNSSPENLDNRNKQIAEEFITLWNHNTENNHQQCFFTLSGESTEIKKEVAAYICEALGLQLKIMPSMFIPANLTELKQFVITWNREILLNDYLLMVQCDDRDETEPDRQRSVDFFIDKLEWSLICCSESKRKNTAKEQFSFEIRKPLLSDQKEYWNKCLGESSEKNDVQEISSHFDLSFKDIRTCVTQFKAAGNKPLWEICRSYTKVKIDHLAQRITPSPGALDLILPTREKEVLEDIVSHVKLRSTVYDDWGLLKNSTRGQGITVLFAGASGTGKTTAAEFLALKLNLDLYRIDLSCVVSKYIGETEKNLQKIFAGAEESGAILLFDEADALFSKRTQVKDSHDRHANTEVSYLLQRMEAYRGLAILTTNFRDSLDKAFIRRLRFIVQFPFPSPMEREEIWRSMIPESLPSKDLDYKKLAQLNAAGGNIRNITMNASFIAASKNEKLQMKHFLKAAREEYFKLHKNLTEMEVRGWV